MESQQPHREVHLPPLPSHAYLSMDLLYNSSLSHIPHVHRHLKALPESRGMEQQHDLGFKH